MATFPLFYLNSFDMRDLNQDLFMRLADKERDVIAIISGQHTSTSHKQLIKDILCRKDFKTLTNIKNFFVLNEMYEFAAYIDEAFELKNINYIKSILCKN